MLQECHLLGPGMPQRLVQYTINYKRLNGQNGAMGFVVAYLYRDDKGILVLIIPPNLFLDPDL